MTFSVRMGERKESKVAKREEMICEWITSDDETLEGVSKLFPLVRCKDCKNYNAGFECLIEGYGIERPKDWFCADGERRSE